MYEYIPVFSKCTYDKCFTFGDINRSPMEDESLMLKISGVCVQFSRHFLVRTLLRMITSSHHQVCIYANISSIYCVQRTEYVVPKEQNMLCLKNRIFFVMFTVTCYIHAFHHDTCDFINRTLSYILLPRVTNLFILKIEPKTVVAHCL